MNMVFIDPRVPSEGFLSPIRRFFKRILVESLGMLARKTGPNPTRNWERNPEVDLILDLDNNTFSGVGFGDPYTALSFLGPCYEFAPMTTVFVGGRKVESKPTVSYGLHYRSDGIGFSIDQDMKVEIFDVLLRSDPETPKSTVYKGKIVWKNQMVELATLENIDSMVRIFGTPDKDTQKPGMPSRRVLRYSQPDATWIVFADESGRTKSLYIAFRRDSHGQGN